MVEQRRHPLLEQRQPVLHPSQAPSVADGLVQRVLRGIGAEPLAVFRTEALDRVLGEQRFARRQQQVAVDRAGGPLGVRVEQPQRFELVVEEVEPQALVEPGGEDVEDRAAYGELAGVDHGVGARVALPLQQRGSGSRGRSACPA